MEYTADAIRESWEADEVARLVQAHRPHFALSAADLGEKVMAPSLALASAEHAPPFTLADLTPGDIDAAIYELARERAEDPARISDQVLALTGGERDIASRAVALTQLRGMTDAEADDLLVGLSVSAEERRSLAAEGKAMPDGSFPAHDLAHLASAVARWKGGQHGGHSSSAIRAHLVRNARALGIEADLGDEDGFPQSHEGPKPRASRHPRHATRPVQVTRRGQYPSGEGGGPEGGGGASGEGGGSMAASGRHLRVKVADGVKTIALTAGQELELGLAEPIGGDDPVSRIMDRNPELFLARGYDDGRPPSAFASDPRVLMRDPPFEVHDTGSSQDGESITPDQLAEIERLTQVNDTMIGGKPIRPYGVNISYRPKSLRARNAAERRENTRPSNPITS